MKLRSKKYHFTLVELLVSLGVFSILLIIFMQFFSGARLVWTNSEKRTQVYTNSRVAMNTLSLLLNSLYYSSANVYTPSEAGRFLFRVHQPSNNILSHKIYFASKTVADLPGRNPIRFIGIQLPTPDDTTSYPNTKCGDSDNPLYNKLIMTVISDEDAYFGALFPPFLRLTDPKDNPKAGDPGACADVIDDLCIAMNGNKKLLAEPTTFEASRIELLDKVTRFKVRVFDENGIELTVDSDRNIDNVVPFMIEISLAMLSDEDFTLWIGMKGGRNQKETAGSAAEAFRRKNEFMFVRRFYIGNR